MEEVATYTETFRKNYDPTHTTALRNAFAKAMRRRFVELTRVIKTSVDTNDCFGLRREGIHSLQMNPATPESFAFARSQQKVEAFMKWMQEQVDKGILTIGEFKQIGEAVEKAWTDLYIYDSYKRGVIRARYELKKAGFDIPSIEDTGGVVMSMSTPFHIDRLGLLFTRVYNDLKGITAAMDMQISRILAQGMADGDGPALLARKLIATINGTKMGDLGITDTLGRFIPAARRAEILARTEIIRAHHVAMVQEYRNWGLEGVYVKAEWRTAGDDRVCEKCAPMEGKIFTLDEIEGLIPFHPLCRCIGLPFTSKSEKYKNWKY